MSSKEEILAELRVQMSATTGDGFFKSESQVHHVAVNPGCDMSFGEDETISDYPDENNEPAKPKMTAFQRVVFLLGYSARFSTELRNRLIREGFSEAESFAAVERACELGLIDDAAHAEAVVRNKLAQGKELSLIKRELQTKGVHCAEFSFWNQLCSEQTPEKSLARALDYAKRHPGTGKHPSDSLKGRLLRRGFSYSVAQQVVDYFDRFATDGVEA